MAKTKTKPYDAAEYLETEEDMAAYLQAAFEEGDAALVIHALGNIAACPRNVPNRSQDRLAP